MPNEVTTLNIDEAQRTLPAVIHQVLADDGTVLITEDGNALVVVVPFVRWWSYREAHLASERTHRQLPQADRSKRLRLDRPAAQVPQGRRQGRRAGRPGASGRGED